MEIEREPFKAIEYNTAQMVEFLLWQEIWEHPYWDTWDKLRVYHISRIEQEGFRGVKAN